MAEEAVGDLQVIGTSFKFPEKLLNKDGQGAEVGLHPTLSDDGHTDYV